MIQAAWYLLSLIHLNNPHDGLQGWAFLHSEGLSADLRCEKPEIEASGSLRDQL